MSTMAYAQELADCGASLALPCYLLSNLELFDRSAHDFDSDIVGKVFGCALIGLGDGSSNADLSNGVKMLLSITCCLWSKTS